MALSGAQTQAIRKLLRTGATARVARILERHHPADAAALFTDLTPAESRLLFDALLALPRTAEVLEALPEPLLEEALRRTADDRLATVLAHQPPDDVLRLLDRLPEDRRREVLDRLPSALAEEVRRLRRYPAGSAGAIMSPRFLALSRESTVAEAVTEARRRAPELGTIFYLYITDPDGRLTGVLSLRQLLLAEPDVPLHEVMTAEPVAVEATESQERAAAVAARYNLLAVPVTEDGRLVGVITVDDVLDVLERAATEDIQKIGGTEALDEPYLRMPLLRLLRRRAGWLLVLFLGEMLTATAMSFFEQEIARAVVLALFVPLIISSGGNSGSQAATLVIRALALGEVRLADWWRVLRRELLSGLSLGTVLGCVGFLRITVWALAFDLYGPHWPLVAVTVFLALVGVVLWGTLSGSMLPLLLRRLGFDPAASSAPFVATLVDVTGLVIYFAVASITLRGTLL